MKRFLLILVVAAAALIPLVAQEKQPETVRKLVKLEHVGIIDVTFLLNGWIRTFPSKELATIILQGTAAEVAEAVKVIGEVDRPRSGDPISEGSVEIDAYFVSAGSESSGGAIPPLVQTVVAALQERFAYAHYGLLDSALIQVSIGTEAQVWGEFARAEDLPVSYKLQLRPTRVSGSQGDRSIKLSQMEASWDIPHTKLVMDKETRQTIPATQYHTLRIQTDVSIPEGKLVVVGKAGSPTSAQAIFLVLRARLVE